MQASISAGSGAASYACSEVLMRRFAIDGLAILIIATGGWMLGTPTTIEAHDRKEVLLFGSDVRLLRPVSRRL